MPKDPNTTTGFENRVEQLMKEIKQAQDRGEPELRDRKVAELADLMGWK